MNKEKTGQFITTLRKEKNMTQKQLSELVYKSVAAVSKWERGENYPDIETIKLLSKIFEVDFSELVEGERNLDSKNVIEDTSTEKDMNSSLEKYNEHAVEKRLFFKKKITIILIIILFVFTLLIGTYFYDKRKQNDFNFVKLFYYTELETGNICEAHVLINFDLTETIALDYTKTMKEKWEKGEIFSKDTDIVRLYIYDEYDEIDIDNNVSIAEIFLINNFVDKQ